MYLQSDLGSDQQPYRPPTLDDIPDDDEPEDKDDGTRSSSNSFQLGRIKLSPIKSIFLAVVFVFIAGIASYLVLSTPSPPCYGVNDFFCETFTWPAPVNSNDTINFGMGQNFTSVIYNVKFACTTGSSTPLSSEFYPIFGTSKYDVVKHVYFGCYRSGVCYGSPNTTTMTNLRCYDANGNPVTNSTLASGSPLAANIYINYTMQPAGNSYTVTKAGIFESKGK